MLQPLRKEVVSHAGMLPRPMYARKLVLVRRTELFGAGRSPQRRSSAGIAASALLHAAGGAAAVYLAWVGPSTLPRPVTRAATFVSLREIPVILPNVRVTPLQMPGPKAAEAPRLELPIERLDVAPPRAPETRQAEAQPRRVEPTPRELPAEPETPKRLPAPLKVGAFSSSAIQAHAPDPTRQVEAAGFDSPSARAPELKLGSTEVGAFVGAAAAAPQPGTDRPGTALGNAGFDSATGASAPSPAPRALGNPGFGSAKSDGKPRSTPPKPAAQIQPIGFTDVRASQREHRRSPQPDRVDTPVEVLSKPTPAYTDEARALKVEGEVLLDVLFDASGHLRVVRVVDGLGHGLDESAIRAAERIQFRPAQSNGRPADSRAIVHIVFRLT